MPFLVLEIHNGLEYATIVMDTFGENKVFTTKEAAKHEADDCLDGIVIEIGE